MVLNFFFLLIFLCGSDEMRSPVPSSKLPRVTHFTSKQLPEIIFKKLGKLEEIGHD